MDEAKHLKVLENGNVSPPPGSIPTTTLRLTFFDLLWFPSSNIQRLFFYEFPYPTSQFMETILPLLKHSLSLTLRHFFPFAANIVCSPPPGKPYIRYKDGDFVTFTVVESPADLHRLIANYPRDVRLLHPFAPRLQNAVSPEEDGAQVIPAVAFRVTVFPNAGVCIGCNYCHVIGDGKTFMDFMRTWSYVYAAAGGGDLPHLEKPSLPLLNKDVIKDPIGVESFLLEVYHDWLSSSSHNTLPVPTDVGSAITKVRGTFVLCRADVERLKQMVKSQCKNEADSDQFHVSTFVVTCSLIWVSLIKSKESLIKNSLPEFDDEFYYFLFPFDCRNRLEFPIPEAYFGNCIKPGIAEMKKTELIGENGIVLAAKAIGGKVKEMGKSGLSGAENWIPDIVERSKTGRLIGVAGSPKLRVYDTEFGWGRPRKVEVVHIESGEAISLAEQRDEGGGIEVGVALNSNQMDEFVAIFEQTLKLV